MNWTDISKKLVAGGLPLLGGAVAGTAGAAVGNLIASTLGLKDSSPATINAALNGEAFAKLRELELNHERELFRMAVEGESKNIAEVNATMRAESTSEHWAQWMWRPFWGFASGLAFAVVSVLCCWLAYQAVMTGDMVAIGMIPQLVGSFATLFAIPGAILGVASWWRGKQKVEADKHG